MKVIKIDGAQNKHVKYLFNYTQDIMRANKCGGLFEMGKNKIQINAWSKQVANTVKEALSKLKIIFTEEDK